MKYDIKRLQISCLSGLDNADCKKIDRFVMFFGINPKLQGYYFIRDCLSFLILDSSYSNNYNGMLYNAVANRHSVSNRAVERSIRFAIINSSIKSKLQYYKDKLPRLSFLLDNDYPFTNKKFIQLLYVIYINRIDILNN